MTDTDLETTEQTDSNPDNLEPIARKMRKVAVITGASSGIGRATALEFASKGYNVVITARRNDELLDVADACELYQVQAIAIAADVTDEEAIRHVAEHAVDTFGHIDVWVNNAAVALFGKFEETPIEEFEQVLDVNIMGYVYGARIAIKQFKDQGFGTLINVSSTNAIAPQPLSSAYNMSKFAIRGLSMSLRMELELEGLSETIQVCNAMPSSTDTNLFQNAANYTGHEIRALEPVYDPSYIARHIVKLTDDPRREIVIGPAGKLMTTEYKWLPKLYERFMGNFVEKNQMSKIPMPSTDGNLYEPLEANSGIRGGWRKKRLRADTLNMSIGLVFGSIATVAGAGYLLYRKRSS